MKKKLPTMLLSSFLLIGLASCTPTTSSSDGPVSGGSPTTSADAGTSTSNGGTTTSETTVTVTGVTISGYTDTTVFDGSTITLKATVDANVSGLKVNWSVSDETVATVVNGVVRFAIVSEDKTVTVTATSRDDETKSGSVTFTVKHCVINLKTSRGSLDSSLMMDEGTIIADTGDIALVYSDVYSTKWYVEAEITIDDQLESDQYPKFGIMTGTSADGYWNQTVTQDDPMKNAFFYCDNQLAGQSSGWSNFNFCVQNDLHTDWDWGSQLGGFVVSNENKMQYAEGYRMGLLRDGTDYYLFAKKGDDIACYKHVVYSDIDAETPSYAWIGGWSTGVTVTNFKALVGEDVDAMYGDVDDFTLGSDEQILFVGETYQINVTTPIVNYDPKKLTFESSDSAVATVDAKGLVTATQTPGEADITVRYENISKVVHITVTDDENFKVELDGLMNDSIYTDQVKANKITHNKSDNSVQIDFYSTRNSRGVYIFADYRTKEIHSSSNWWEADNFELRLTGPNGLLTNKHEVDIASGNQNQYWASTFSGVGDHNFTDGYIGEANLNEETSYYEISFELFISYEYMGVSKTDPIGYTFGANPGGSSWYQGSNFGTGDITKANPIYYSEADCPTEEHVYGDWVTTKEANCSFGGEETRTCALCGHKDVRETPAEGDHTYDLADATVVTAPTCNSTGTGTVECTTCHETIEVTLPIDPNNHSGHDFSEGPCPGCGETIDPDNPIVNNTRATSGGWASDRSTWTDLFTNMTGDFTAKAVYTFEGGKNDATTLSDYIWCHPLVVVHDSNNVSDGAISGDSATFRLDWYGWMDDRNGDGVKIADSNSNGTMFVENFDRDMPGIIHGPTTVALTVTRSGNDLTLDYVITASTGEVYTFQQGLSGLHTDTLNVSLSAEYATFTVTSIKL